MKRIHYQLTLTSPVSITANAATIGAHTTLDRITGGRMLGAVAASLYQKLGADADAVFHSDAVRFGDARPVGFDDSGTDIGVAAPFPLCVQQEKGSDDAPLHNLSVAGRPEGKQLKARRSGALAVTGDPVPVSPTRHYAMKTAVTADGTASDGLLFGIESLAADQVFRGTITCDDDGVAERLDAALRGLDRVRLGRSRSAEFGAAALQVQSVETVKPAGGESLSRLTAWLLSDAALADPQTGMPTTHPSPANVGLGDAWKLDEAHSFWEIDTRTPFNGKWKRPHEERVVLVAGSVLVFTASTPQPRADIDAWAQRGIGLHRRDGYGEVAVNPEVLAGKGVKLQDSVGATPAAKGLASVTASDLYRWLDEQAQATVSESHATEQLEGGLQRFRHARLSASQWGFIRGLALDADRAGAAPDTLAETVRSETTRGVRGGSRVWGQNLRGQRAGDALADWIKDSGVAPREVAELARLCASRKAKEQ